MMDGYYTGIGRSIKTGDANYIQAARKSALDDLVSQIKVSVSSTSVLSQMEMDKRFTEQYEQIIQTSVADEIQEFEMVDAYEEPNAYWVYYRLSKARYRQIKEEQKRNAVTLATDFYSRARQADKAGERLQAIGFYFQAFRSIEKYLDEPIRLNVEGREILLANEIYSSIQSILDRIELKAEPAELLINRRIPASGNEVLVRAFYKDLGVPAAGLPVTAIFEKGQGDVFPSYKINEAGSARILFNRIGSKDLEQVLAIRADAEALTGGTATPVFSLVSKTLHTPEVRVRLKVQRPVCYLSSDEKSLGGVRTNMQLSNKLRNLLSTNGFEFTDDRDKADLWFDVRADSEKGSVSGSIYITYLTGIIRVTSREGKEIYATTLDRIKGFGLDYDRSSVDAYTKALDVLEKEKMNEMVTMVLQ